MSISSNISSNPQRNRSNNRYLTVNGVTKLLCEWAEETGIHSSVILTRIKRGVPEDQWMSKDHLVRRDSIKQSGVKYVYWHKKTGKWSAVPMIDGKKKYLGLFDTVDKAKEAIDIALGTTF